MAIGDSIKQGTNNEAALVTNNGSVKSNWIVANSKLSQVNTSTELLRPGATATSNVTPIRVPPGATRVMLRTRRAAAATTLTTDPVLQIWGVDDDASETYTGAPTRIDNSDSNDSGITQAASSTDASDSAATYLYSDVSAGTDGNGYDCLGSTWIFVLVKTAANYSASTTVAALVKFLN